jgi:hypothetical protein
VNAARRPHLSPAETRRADQLDDIRDAVNDLIRHVKTATTMVRDKGAGLDGVVRGAPVNQLHRTKEPGLVLQLQHAAGVRHAVPKPGYGIGSGYTEPASWLLDSESTAAVRYGEGGHNAPTSRPNADLMAVDLLADIAAGSRAWRQKLGGKGRRPLVGELRALTGLAHTASNAQVHDLVRDTQSWVRSSRMALAYDPGVVDLPDMCCPDCGGDLRVMADASSDVWCAGGPWPRCIIATHAVRAWTPGCGATWPRGQWLLLLEAMEDEHMSIVEFLEARLAEDEQVAAHVDDAVGPARVLREVEAKRAILAWVTGAQSATAAGDEQAFHDEEAAALTFAIRALASVYSDHPDYQQAWAPEATAVEPA